MKGDGKKPPRLMPNVGDDSHSAQTMSNVPTSSSAALENGTDAKRRGLTPLKAFVTFWKDFIVPFLALFGAIGALFLLTDRFFPPSVEVLGVLPVYVRGANNVTIDGQRQSFPRRGVSFILLLQSKDREVSITELAISGRLYLTLNEWIAGHGTNGIPISGERIGVGPWQVYEMTVQKA